MLKVELPCDPTIPYMRCLSKEMKILPEKDIRNPMFIYDIIDGQDENSLCSLISE